MSEADKMLEELGYHKFFGWKKYLEYKNTVDGADLSITFWYADKTVSKDSNMRCGYITMQELKAINKKCLELGWIEE